MPGKYNMTVWRGNDYDVSFGLKDSNDDAFDLTDMEVVFRAEWSTGSMRYSSEDSPLGDSYITIDDETGGIVKLHLEPDGTRLLSQTEAIDYEIEIRSLTEETTVLYGKIGVVGGVNDDA